MLQKPEDVIDALFQRRDDGLPPLEQPYFVS